MEALISLIAVMLVYFLPAIIAAFRRHHNGAAIALLDLLLGWTVLGWIAALIWSVTRTEPGAAQSGRQR